MVRQPVALHPVNQFINHLERVADHQQLLHQQLHGIGLHDENSQNAQNNAAHVEDLLLMPWLADPKIAQLETQSSLSQKQFEMHLLRLHHFV